MEFALEIFPQLDKVPDSIAATLHEMLNCYRVVVEKKRKLNKHKSKSHLFEIEDSQGKTFCLFKKYNLEYSAKKDVAIYLLDHPLHENRSTSSALLGLSGVPPTVFIRTKDGFGCLIKFLNCSGTVNDFKSRSLPQFRNGLPEEIQKVCIAHIRFGCSDAHEDNTLVTQDESGISRLSVIDNEECFTNYKLRILWWLNIKEAEEDFSSQLEKYVRQLNVDLDISFLKKSGWEAPTQFITQLKIFTDFLKLSVQFQLKPKDIGLLATGNYKKHPNVNLHDMVNASDRKNGDVAFVKSAHSKIEEGLKEYVFKVYKRRIR